MRHTTIEDVIISTACAALTAWVVINWFSGCGQFERTPDGYVTGSCFLMPEFEIHIHDLPQ